MSCFCIPNPKTVVIRKVSQFYLPTFHDWVDGYAVAMHEKSSQVFITRGNDLFVYNLKRMIWSKGPSLNKARTHHSSICLGSTVYVIGGLNAYSVEALDLASETVYWKVIASGYHFKRSNSALAVLDKHHIAIIGGLYCNTWYKHNACIIFDTKHCTHEVVPCDDSDFIFSCVSDTWYVGGNKFITLGKDLDEE